MDNKKVNSKPPVKRKSGKKPAPKGYPAGARRKKKDARGIKAGAVTIVILLIIAVGFAAFLYFRKESRTPSTERMSAEQYFGQVGENEQLIITTENVCESRGVVIDGELYINYETVSQYVNDRLYLDESSGILTVTTPTEIINIDAYIDADGRAIVRDDVLYISIDFIADYSDIRIETFTGPDRIVFTNNWKLKRAYVNEEGAAIRYEASIKSPIIKSAGKSETVVILEDCGDFQKVSTKDGFIGYIDSMCLGEQFYVTNHNSPIGEYITREFDGKVNMAFHQTDRQMANELMEESLTNVTGVNVIAPTWFFIDDEQGNLIDLTNEGYVAKAHDRGLEVWAVINDFDGGINSKDSTYKVLKDTIIRQRIVDNVVNTAIAAGIDGINVDIENVKEDCAPSYLEFIRELSAKCRSNNLVLSIDTYVPQRYNRYLDIEEQGAVADYVVIMAYDEHTNGSKSAGSVSSISWVETAVDETLKDVDASKVIIAIPFYTRKWETSNGSVVSSSAMGMREAEQFVNENGLDVKWDDVTQQNVAESEGSPHYIVWLEDEQSIEAKMSVIKQAKVAGVAEWKLGLEKPEVWGVISSNLT